MLGLNQISEIVNAILLWLPHLVVAIAIIVIGALIARFVGGLVRGTTSQMGFSNAEILGNVAYYAILVFAAIAAIDQLGIAETLVNTLLIGLVATVVLAAGLAFGLGGQQTAARITEGWYESGRQASRKVVAYARLIGPRGWPPTLRGRRLPRRRARRRHRPNGHRRER